MRDREGSVSAIFAVVRSFLLDRGVRWRALFGVTFACVAAAASVGLVGLAGWFIAASALAGISGTAAFVVAYPSSGIRAFAVVRVISRYLERLTNHHVTFSLLSRLRVYFFERALRIPSDRYGRYRSGDLLGRATSDIDSLDNFFPRVLVPTVSALVVCAGSVTFIAYFSVMLAAILAVGCVVAGIALPLVSSIAGRGPGEEISRTRTRLRTGMVEVIEGLPEVRSYGAGSIVAVRLEATADDAARAERKAKLADATGTSLGTFAAQITVVATLVAGIWSYQTVGLAGPVVALAVLLATGVFEQLGALPAAYRTLGLTRAAAARLSEIFVGPEEESGRNGLDLPEGRLEIEATDVTFRYEGREDPALDGVSFYAAAGGVTVFAAPSGAGKTTLLRLISGELVPDLGTVALGGVPVREVSAGNVAQRLAYVSQDEHVFGATLGENLRIAAPEATDEVLVYVLEAVGLSEFYDGLEAGLETEVGEHGRAVSGGQRRRLAVARALLRRPDVILLDEPTGGLDEEAARLMLSGIRENLPHSTVVISTHDPDLASEVLPEAGVVEIGGRRAGRRML